MKVGALLTSAGINIGLCILFLSFYSVLRKQPQNVKVYFGRRIAEQHKRLRGAFILERFVPSPSWIVRSLQCTEDEILSTAGLDAVVFNRVLVFRCIYFYFCFLCLCNIYCSMFMIDIFWVVPSRRFTFENSNMLMWFLSYIAFISNHWYVSDMIFLLKTRKIQNILIWKPNKKIELTLYNCRKIGMWSDILM